MREQTNETFQIYRYLVQVYKRQLELANSQVAHVENLQQRQDDEHTKNRELY